jgi:RNA polymerase sigma-70 factor (ECF subfamily)
MCHETLAPGSTAWLSALARDHTRALAAVARGEGLGPDDALDAVQEAFATFLARDEAIALAGAPDQARAMLVTITRNAARNLRRRHHRARPHDPLDDAPLASDEPTADQLLALAEDRARVIVCMGRLGEIHRRVVHMRVLEELSGAAVAESLGLTPGHVAVLLHRARRDLHACVTTPDVSS